MTTRYWTTQQIVQTVRLNYLISEFLNFDIDPQNILKGIYFHIITQSSLNKLSPSDIGMRVCDDRQFANETISYWTFQICASLFQFWDNLFKQKHPSPIIINYCVFFTESKRNSAIYLVSCLEWKAWRLCFCLHMLRYPCMGMLSVVITLWRLDVSIAERRRLWTWVVSS